MVPKWFAKQQVAEEKNTGLTTKEDVGKSSGATAEPWIPAKSKSTAKEPVEVQEKNQVMKITNGFESLTTRDAECIQEPLLCMGDYNAILSSEDKIQGNPVQDLKYRDFNEFLVNAGMTEMRTTKCAYTWFNGITCSKIDRVVVNAEWLLKYPKWEIIVMVPGTSDHNPLCMDPDNRIINSPKVFRFFNAIVEHPEFINKVRTAWKSSSRNCMQNVWYNLKQVKANLQEINIANFKGVTARVKDLRTQLHQL
ncbi:hypothetical protein FXO38_23697 [Capsicum annuum]|uniref:Endonuclease/exonuclease/phosphatase domain-containing protein n=1 Tax=Capsicum annuum TaxID=4072 RepID=A0A2G2ZJ72_CAPAN|nr:hypothetical protein FXO38_23697 [Capsicum annuum]KAF3656814.1 hypothetical protein FXO37_15275 [Capsicum annuum]PHT82057.1 hypothetical protein T459_15072 [Capsicum annuum]